MNSERIRAIGSDIFEKDIVLEVGCDHGYISMYLKKEKLCKEVYASDLRESALNVARKNFVKHNMKIETFLSDGFNNIPVKFNTAIIAGMGTNTILNILNHKNKPRKLVLGGQNDLPRLRKEVHEMGYKLVDEQAVWENGHYYIILLFVRQDCVEIQQQLTKWEIKFGISNNDNYYAYLIKKNKEIMKKVPLKKWWELFVDNIILTGLIKRT